MMLTKTKPFSILGAPSLGFSKDLLNDPRISHAQLLKFLSITLLFLHTEFR